MVGVVACSLRALRAPVVPRVAASRVARFHKTVCVQGVEVQTITPGDGKTFPQKGDTVRGHHDDGGEHHDGILLRLFGFARNTATPVFDQQRQLILALEAYPVEGLHDRPCSREVGFSSSSSEAVIGQMLSTGAGLCPLHGDPYQRHQVRLLSGPGAALQLPAGSGQGKLLVSFLVVFLCMEAASTKVLGVGASGTCFTAFFITFFIT